MNEPSHLLHNMSAPSRFVVSYRGIAHSADDQQKRSKNSKVRVIAFRMVSRDWLASPTEILKDLGVVEPDDPEAALIRLINERANELPLPDGCLVTECKAEHAQAWQDELAQLAVICKSSSAVWLRSKRPQLSILAERPAVSLYLPNGLSV